MRVLGLLSRFPIRWPVVRRCSLCGGCGHFRVSHREYSSLSNEAFWAMCWQPLSRPRRRLVLHSFTEGRIAPAAELVVMSVDADVLRLVRSWSGA